MRDSIRASLINERFDGRLTPHVTRRSQFGVVSFNLASAGAREPLAMAAASIIIIVAVLAVFAPLVTPVDPNSLSDQTLSGPSSRHLLGTDQLGRDVLSRVIYGARISLFVGFLAAFVGSGLGTLVGITTAYVGGVTDLIAQRVMDTLMSLPTLVLGIAVAAALGPSLETLVVAISLPIVPRAARVLRASALVIVRSGYVDAAIALGATRWRIATRHIAANCVGPYLVILTANLGTAIIAEASLSFLGMGVPPPVATWGGMLSGEARRFFFVAPWMALAPGSVLILVVLAFNLLGDKLHDASDPRARV
jgi:peptide/nickel transport system permease protein